MRRSHIGQLALLGAVGVIAGCSVVHVTERVPIANEYDSTTGELKTTGTEDKTKAKKAVSRKLPGVPFYVKTPRYTQTSVYRQTWLHATLGVETTVTDKEGRVAPASKPEIIVRDFLIGDTALDALRESIHAVRIGAMDASTVRDSFRSHKSADTTTAKTMLIKNAVQTDWVVDTARTYYLNAPFPWFGSATLTQKLNSDGTLSQATTTADSKLSEGLTAFVPFKEFFTSKWISSGDKAATEAATKSDFEMQYRGFQNNMRMLGEKPPPEPAQTSYTITLSMNIEEKGREYTLTSRQELKPFEATSSVPFSTAQIAAGTVLVTVRDLAEKPDAKDEGLKIGLSGSVALPKEWGAPKPEK